MTILAAVVLYVLLWYELAEECLSGLLFGRTRDGRRRIKDWRRQNTEWPRFEFRNGTATARRWKLFRTTDRA